MIDRPWSTGTPTGRDQHGDRGYTVETGESVHYRYGYVVVGAAPRLCGIKTSLDTAQQEADIEARSVYDELQRLGAPAHVAAWTQSVTATTTVEYDEAVSATVTKGNL